MIKLIRLIKESIKQESNTSSTRILAYVYMIIIVVYLFGVQWFEIYNIQTLALLLAQQSLLLGLRGQKTKTKNEEINT